MAGTSCLTSCSRWVLPQLAISEALFYAGRMPPGGGRAPAATRAPSTQCVHLALPLQEGRANVDLRTDGHYTPLMIAAACGNRHAVEALLAHGACLSLTSSRGATRRVTVPCCACACRHGSSAACPSHACPRCPSCSLHFAAQTPGGAGVLQAMLAHHSCTPALVRQAGFRERSATMLSVLCHGSGPMVQQLLAAGADPNERQPASQGSASVLHTCAHLARLDAMRALIDAGAAVGAVAADGINVCIVSTGEALRGGRREGFERARPHQQH